MPAFDSLGKALRWLRLERDLTQGEVARTAGLTPAMLSSYERGRRIPTLQSLGKLLDTLGVGLAELGAAIERVNPGGKTGGGVRPSAAPGSGAPSGPRAGATRHGGSAGARQSGAAESPAPPVDLHQALGIDRELPADTEVALGQMLNGFCHWLRVLHSKTEPEDPDSGT